MEDPGGTHVPHKKKTAGGKVKKKQQNDKKARHNPKAFTFSGGAVKSQRNMQRMFDVQTKREAAKLVPDKTPLSDAPPYVVVIQGPQGSGKTTLIRSLVKHYTKHSVNAVHGPITVVSGKARRLTFVECPNDVGSMVDLAKVADLVLLMIDGSFGFEMETFEFLNILQVHGFPRIMGILTHLDGLPDRKSLRHIKKKLKNRFWAEIYDGAKLFYLSGLQYGRYNKTEILNLARFISVQKFFPLSFRSARPYLLALRYETDRVIESGETSEKIQVKFYGYVKGSHMRAGEPVHLPGVGDFKIDNLRKLNDPCPMPGHGVENKNDSNRHLRTLKIDQRRYYAPDSEMGALQYDDDGAFHITLPKAHKIGFTPKELIIPQTAAEKAAAAVEDEEDVPEAVKMVRTLQKAVGKLSETVEAQKLTILTDKDRRRAVPEGTFTAFGVEDRGALERTDGISDSELELDSEGEQNSAAEVKKLETDMLDDVRTRADSEESSDDSEDDMSEAELMGASKGLLSSTKATENQFVKPVSIAEVVYGRVGRRHAYSTFSEGLCLPVIDHTKGQLLDRLSDESSCIRRTPMTSGSSTKNLFDDSDEESDPNDALIKAGPHRTEKLLNEVYPLLGDISAGSRCHEGTKLLGQDLFTSLRSKGVQSEITVAKVGGDSKESSSMSSLFSFWTSALKKAMKMVYFITGGWDGNEEEKTAAEQELSTEPTEAPVKPSSEVKNGQKKDSGIVTNEMQALWEKQRAQMKEESAKLAAEKSEAYSIVEKVDDLAVIGCYVCVTLSNIPAKWMWHAKKAEKTVLLGGLLSGETELGMLQVRLKRHRWAPNVLKSNDPLFVSLGWRRFQTLPLYSLEDRNDVRVRMLKYTPEHMHCLATFYGPVTAPSTGMVAIQNWTDKLKNFRISATGVVIEAAPDFKVMKKLKLVGEPSKIFKNTAFIKNMFSSDLEVAKCVNAKIQTVSGIRGEIKKPQGHDGLFRATFEDKIQMSDIVICKAWVRVPLKEFYNPVIDVPEWKRLRTIAELRRAYELPAPDSKNSDYTKKPEHPPVPKLDTKIPTSLEKALSFDARPKTQAHTKKKKDHLSLVERLSKPVGKSEYEKSIESLLGGLHIAAKMRELEKKEKAEKRAAKSATEAARISAKREENHKEERKKRYAKQGAKEKKDRKRMRMED